MFKRAITYVEKNDSDLSQEVVRFGKDHEFGDVWWLPSQKKALYRVDDRVSIYHSGNGLYDFIPLRSAHSDTLATSRGTG